MTEPKTIERNESWRIIVIGAEDVAQHLRTKGHRVSLLDHLPHLGLKNADAAVLEIGDNVEARDARKVRSCLIEPVLIHQHRADRATFFLGIRRSRQGAVPLHIVDDVLAHAVERTLLLRRLAALDADAPTERVTLELPIVDLLPR